MLKFCLLFLFYFVYFIYNNLRWDLTKMRNSKDGNQFHIKYFTLDAYMRYIPTNVCSIV